MSIRFGENVEAGFVTHKEVLAPDRNRLLLIDGFKNYTAEQNTRYRNGKKLNKDDMSQVPDFNVLMHREGLNAVEASRRYVEWCEERGYLPKFHRFAYKTVNGERVFNENYYKLLKDFTTMVDGVYHPQEAVKMVFPNKDSAFGSMAEPPLTEFEEGVVNTENGVRGSIAGEDAVDADLLSLSAAINQIPKGFNPDTVRRRTGWWMGKDGKWRYEISDKDMNFDKEGYVKNPETLADFIKHEKLFKSYPQLRDIKAIAEEIVLQEVVYE